jgi:hypothetical protein
MPTTLRHADYDDALDALSAASVNVHFDAFEDIAWDDPELQIDPSDPRWKLPAVDPLGRHPWYRALSEERQIEVGLLRQANTCKIGTHFETALMRGLLQYVVTLPNGSREFRYCMHEVTEETNHTQMFQEFVNRAGADVPGAVWWFRLATQFVPALMWLAPEVFFLMVLMGEEPLDHVQKDILRGGEEIHPLLRRIMQIHVAEEARHISFAHEFLTERMQTMGPIRRTSLTVAFPVLAKAMGIVVGSPSRTFAKRAGIPRTVISELYTHDEAARSTLNDMFADVRYFADKVGARTTVTRPLWRLLGVDGRVSRHRGEPTRPVRA